MYHPIAFDPATPRSVRAFIASVCDVYLADVHAMLRLPNVDAQITQACNFAITACLMNAISGASIVLYEPPPNRQDTGRKFRETLENFYPWNREPHDCIRNAADGAGILYYTFRNPMAHAFGFQNQAPQGTVSITRVAGHGFTEQELEDIEQAAWRPGLRLGGTGTLRRDAVTESLALNAESFYWGVREMLRRLTADANRMRNAATYLDPLLVPVAPPPVVPGAPGAVG
jgi:hypothetical protein